MEQYTQTMPLTDVDAVAAQAMSPAFVRSVLGTDAVAELSDEQRLGLRACAVEALRGDNAETLDAYNQAVHACKKLMRKYLRENARIRANQAEVRAVQATARALVAEAPDDLVRMVLRRHYPKRSATRMRINMWREHVAAAFTGVNGSDGT